MGRYPQALLDFFNAYLKDSLLLIALLATGFLLLNFLFKFVDKTFGLNTNFRRNNLFKAFNFLLSIAIVFSSLWLIYPNLGTSVISLASLFSSLIISFRSEIANFFVWYFWLSKKRISTMDYLRIGEYVGVVKALSNHELILQTSSGVTSFQPLDLPGMYFQNLSEQSLEKSTLVFRASSSFDLEEFYAKVQREVSDIISVVKLEFPTSILIDSEQEVKINIWSYPDFSWEIYNEVFPFVNNIASVSANNGVEIPRAKTGKA